MIDLLDASVWTPLATIDHDHLPRVWQYLDFEASQHVAFCRVTSLALLRHLTNRNIMGAAVLTGPQSWDYLQDLLALPQVVWLSGPQGIDNYLQRFSSLADGHRVWTDAYLAAFAAASGSRFVTFDRGFARYPRLNLLQLNP